MSQFEFDHEYWMHYALSLARQAWNEGEVPVGAVLIYDNRIIGEGWNRSISCHDPTAHAEIIALRQGGLVQKNYRLQQCTLYITLEPCLMCSGAIVCGRIDTIVFGASSNKTSILNLLMNKFKYYEINHKVRVIDGILKVECSKIIKDFFHLRRLQRNIKNN